jgi:hypothetical protein
MLSTGGKYAVFRLDPCGIQTVSRTLIADAQISRGSPRKYDVWFATLVMHCAQRVESPLNSLSGQTLGAIAAVRYRSSQNFVTNMYNGCPIDRASGLSTDGSRVWGRYTDSHSNQKTTDDVLGYTSNAQAFQVGTLKEIQSKLVKGGGAFDLDVETKNAAALAAAAGIELGSNIALKSGSTLRPFVSAAGE